MTQVKIAELKSHLSAYLKMVRLGDEVLVLDRETPIAKLIPIPASRPPLQIIFAKRPYADIRNVVLPPPPKKSFDPLKALEEERKDRDFF